MAAISNLKSFEVEKDVMQFATSMNFLPIILITSISFSSDPLHDFPHDVLQHWKSAKETSFTNSKKSNSAEIE